jgi:hypothetical protein
MKIDIKYLTDEKGKRTAVQVPYGDWKYLTQENKKLKQLLKVKSDLQEAFREVEVYKRETLAERRRANRGMAEGSVIMADNFDDPLEDFEKYT